MPIHPERPEDLARRTIRVSTLLGHGQIESGLPCLGSLVRYSVEPVALRIHDDGTLTPRDRDRLSSTLERVEILSRAEADARLEETLERRPATREFRSRNVLGLKLVDVLELSTGDELAYCDSDVLFFRPFQGLFRLGPQAPRALFMADRQNAYSLRSWHLMSEPRLRLPLGVNSGIVVFDKAAYDPELVEWFAARRRYHRTPVWAEQTAWALLGQAVGCQVADPRSLAIPTGPPEGREDLVAAHFVRPVRSLLARYLKEARDRIREAPVTVARIAPGRCTALHLLRDEFLRKLGRCKGGASRLGGVG